MSDRSDFDEEFAERLRRMNLMFDKSIESRVGAAVFAFGAIFAAALISVIHFTAC